MLVIISICTILSAVATLIPLSNKKHWFIRGWDFPRLQIAVFILTILLGIVFFADLENYLVWTLFSINGICLSWQAWWILPYTPLWTKEVKSAKENNPSRQLSIITSNVLTPNKNAKALIDLVNKHQPDIVVTLESDKWWENQLQVLESDMPYSVKCPLENLYGMHLYSKLKLHDEEISILVEKDVPSIHVSIELRCGTKVRAHFLHPAPPSPSENKESSERDAELIIIARSVAKSNQPIIVTGDLNDVAWSSTTKLFRKISSLLDPRIGRGMFNTFHADYPFLRWPLDHIFHSQHFKLRFIQRLPSIGSDHFPLHTSLVFSPINNANKESLESKTKDDIRSKKIVHNEKVSENDVPEPNE